MIRATNAYKGLAAGVLVVIVLSTIVAVAIFLILTGQTDFLSKAARFMASLLVVKVP